MRIDIITLFPKMFSGPFEESIIKRAKDRLLVEIYIHQLRDWAHDKHQTVDDRPFGGGVGMVLKVEPLVEAIEELRGKYRTEDRDTAVIFLTPSGKLFNQKKAAEFSKYKHLIIVAGRYETIDQRVIDLLVDYEISIGDYVLTGGELPAMVFIDAVVRLIPGVLTKPEAIQFESFSPLENSLEHPQYTRPEEFWGIKVPEVLLSGDHKKIEAWKKEKSLEKTKRNRPDLMN